MKWAPVWNFRLECVPGSMRVIALQREELYLHPSEDTDKIGRAAMFLSPPTSSQNPHSLYIFFQKMYLIAPFPSSLSFPLHPRK